MSSFQSPWRKVLRQHCFCGCALSFGNNPMYKKQLLWTVPLKASIWAAFCRFAFAEFGLGWSTWPHRTVPKQLFSCCLCYFNITLKSQRKNKLNKKEGLSLRWLIKGLWCSATVWLPRSSSWGCWSPCPQPWESRRVKEKSPNGEAAPNGSQPCDRIAGQLAPQVRWER